MNDDRRKRKKQKEVAVGGSGHKGNKRDGGRVK